MKLQEIFDQLSGGEFSQLSIGGRNAGVIDESNYGKVLGHVNLALTTLYTRFMLKERRLAFTLQADSDTYQLNLEDLVKITSVLTDTEYELGINQGSDLYSCFTPSLNTIRVPQAILDQGIDLPDALKTEKLTVVYQAMHPKIVMSLGFIDPTAVEVELPGTHLLPLLYFVASRVHNPIGMNNEFHAGNSYYKKYEMACQELEGQGIQVETDTSNTRMSRNGWV